MNHYEKKKQAKADYYREQADKADTESNTAYNTGQEIGSYIPLGQPIMVGHHSEKGHRRDIGRIDNAMRKSIDLSEKADYYRDKADAVENNRSISSDDPDAINKLKIKLEKAEIRQIRMKDINKIIKKKNLNDDQKIKSLIETGISESAAWTLSQPDFTGRIGFGSYELTNNNANIRRMKKRLENLERKSMDITTSKDYGRVKIIDNVEENRTQLVFDHKPEADVRTELKKHGFKWSRINSAWQRHRSYDAECHGKIIIDTYYLCQSAQ